MSAIDNERFVRLAATALERGRSRSLPRALPEQPRSIARPVVQFLDLRPSDGDVDAAIMRISEHGERVTKAVAAEQLRMDEARNAPKRFTRPVEVENPYGKEYQDEIGVRHNRPDKVDRIVDTIDHMLRSRQIDRGQEAAARKVQDAWAVAHGSMRCVLAPSAGGGGGSGSLTDAQIKAGEVLNEVRSSLGELDAPIVIRICAIGLSVEETARIVFGIPDGNKVKTYEIQHVGMRLRMGLAHLARNWRVEGKGGAKVVGMRGAIAGHDNQQNFGSMSESERERSMPLRYAAEQRDKRVKAKAKRKKAKQPDATKGT